MTDRIDNEQFEARLMSHGVYVTELDQTNGTLEIEYESIHAKNGVSDREMGRIINVVRDLLANEAVDIDATVTDLEGNVQGTWHVEAAWLEKLHTDTITETEFSGRVLDTVAEQ